MGILYDDQMGLYERFRWSYSIDGGPEKVALLVRGDASHLPVSYTLASGAVRNLENPAVAFVNPTAYDDVDYPTTYDDKLLVTNVLQNISVPISGSGNQLTLTLYGTVNDNNAGFVFDNIRIEENAAAALPGDYNGNGLVDAADYTIWRYRLGTSSLPNNESASPGNRGSSRLRRLESEFRNVGGSEFHQSIRISRAGTCHGNSRGCMPALFVRPR